MGASQCHTYRGIGTDKRYTPRGTLLCKWAFEKPFIVHGKVFHLKRPLFLIFLRSTITLLILSINLDQQCLNLSPTTFSSYSRGFIDCPGTLALYMNSSFVFLVSKSSLSRPMFFMACFILGESRSSFTRRIYLGFVRRRISLLNVVSSGAFCLKSSVFLPMMS